MERRHSRLLGSYSSGCTRMGIRSWYGLSLANVRCGCKQIRTPSTSPITTPPIRGCSFDWPRSIATTLPTSLRNRGDYEPRSAWSRNTTRCSVWMNLGGAPAGFHRKEVQHANPRNSVHSAVQILTAKTVEERAPSYLRANKLLHALAGDLC